MTVPETTPARVKVRLDAGDPRLVLLDVREPEEIALARLDGALHVPMGDVPSALARLDRERNYVVVCHHGVRSAFVCAFLLARGYLRVENLAGGIDAWSVEVDPAVPRY